MLLIVFVGVRAVVAMRRAFDGQSGGPLEDGPVALRIVARNPAKLRLKGIRSIQAEGVRECVRAFAGSTAKGHS